jgi:NAD(P)H dehydrogenase (quinone)
MILITGAGGKTGRAIVRALVTRGAAVDAFVHRDGHVAPLRALGARYVRVGSLGDRAALLAAARAAEAIYHLAPNVSPDEFAFGQNVAAAAREAGVRRLVFHSVLLPKIEAMPHHWEKARVEEMLAASGLDVTVLQPTAYMQYLLQAWTGIVKDGVYRVPYSVEARISLVDLGDAAEVAARVLTEKGHEGAAYELVGTPPLSQIEVAETLSRALGRPVRAEAESIEAWSARTKGLSDYARDTLIRMFRYYDRHGLPGDLAALRRFLGREPTTLAEFAARVSTSN